jgi:hypothetical protein
MPLQTQLTFFPTLASTTAQKYAIIPISKTLKLLDKEFANKFLKIFNNFLI